MRLKGNRLVIRRPEMRDAEASFRWFSDPEVTRYLPLAGKGNIPMERVKSFLAQAAERDRPELAIIIENLAGEPIGSGGLREIVEGESAELSLILGERSAWGQGLGAEALDLLLDFAFGDMKLATVWLVVRTDNEKGVRLFRSRGFEVEDTMKAAVVVDDIPRDKWRMTLSAQRHASLDRAKSDRARARELAGCADTEVARQGLLALARRNPEDPLIHFLCACQHDKMGLETDAAPFYERALALGLAEPDRERAMTNLGSTYRCIGQYEKAETVLKQALEAYPENGAIRTLLAIAYYNRKKYREASEAFVAELVRSSEDPHIKAYSKPLAFYAEHLDEIWANAEDGE